MRRGAVSGCCGATLSRICGGCSFSHFRDGSTTHIRGCSTSHVRGCSWLSEAYCYRGLRIALLHRSGTLAVVAQCEPSLPFFIFRRSNCRVHNWLLPCSKFCRRSSPHAFGPLVSQLSFRLMLFVFSKVLDASSMVCPMFSLLRLLRHLSIMSILRVRGPVFELGGPRLAIPLQIMVEWCVGVGGLSRLCLCLPLYRWVTLC
jgi:hypothetical protein